MNGAPATVGHASGTIERPGAPFASYGPRGLRRFLRRVLELRAEAMSEADLRRSAIVFAPHPDDETLGCGGTILRKRAAGARVRIVFLTNGCSSHTAWLPTEELTARRRREARAAAGELGVPERDVHFWDFEDNRLADNRAEAVRRATGMLCDDRPAQIFVTSSVDVSPDHVAAADIVRAAAEEACPDIDVLEYLIWFWSHRPWAPRGDLDAVSGSLRLAVRRFRSLAASDLVQVPVRGLHGRKWAALSAHATQMERPADRPDWPVLADVWAGRFLDCAFGDCELFIRRRGTRR